MRELVRPALQRWAAEEARRIGTRLPPVPDAGRRRLLLIHLDGVPRALLEDAVRTGAMPYLSRLVRSGAYHLDGAFWGSPASTPFFQAGLLYGLTHPDLPAYSWFDRQLGRSVRMNLPRDAADVEARLSERAREGLLSGGGHTYFSLFRAHAENRLCMSTAADVGTMVREAPGELGPARVGCSCGMWRYTRQLVREARKAWGEVRRWSEDLGDWRHEQSFFMSRIFLQRLGWSVALSRTLVDLVRGVPAIYLVFGNYDEVGHRRGPLSPLAVRELYRFDGQLARLMAMARQARPHYDVVLVTDHGHTGSVPLEQRTGRRLEPTLFAGAPVPLGEDLRRGLTLGRSAAWSQRRRPEGEPVVVESGNFGHVYLGTGKEPLEALDLVAHAPDVVARAAAHPDLGIVALRRGEGAVALVKGQVFGPDEVDRAPLHPEFNRRALADYLRELPRLPNAGDLVLFGEVVDRGAATVGFAWEFGSHGGLTRTETDATVLWPSDAGLDLGGLSHVTQLHTRLSEAYRERAVGQVRRSA